MSCGCTRTLQIRSSRVSGTDKIMDITKTLQHTCPFQSVHGNFSPVSSNETAHELARWALKAFFQVSFLLALYPPQLMCLWLQKLQSCLQWLIFSYSFILAQFPLLFINLFLGKKEKKKGTGVSQYCFPIVSKICLVNSSNKAGGFALSLAYIISHLVLALGQNMRSSSIIGYLLLRSCQPFDLLAVKSVTYTALTISSSNQIILFIDELNQKQ